MKVIRQLILIPFSILLIAFAINMFLGPYHVAAGGVSGIGILLEHVMGIDRSFIVLFLNMIMLVLAFIFLGKSTFINILLGSILLPLFLYLVPEYKLLSDQILSVISGSMIFGTGVALLYKIDASSGGTTVPPMIFKKYFRLNTSIGLLLTDLTIVIFNIFIFGVDEFFLAVLSLIITSVVMSYLEVAFHQKKVILVRSSNCLEPIKLAAEGILKRDVTMLNVEDGASNVKGNMLMMIANQQQYKQMLKVIDDLDPEALVVVNRVAEAHGISLNYYSA